MDQLAAIDRAVFLAINRGLHSEILNPLFWLITTLGLGYVQVLLLLAGRLLPLRLGRSAFVPSLIALASSGALAQVLKALIARDRPSVSYPMYVSADEMIRYHSFPSGHTITSFAIASVLLLRARRFGRPVLGWYWMAVAALVGVSRIYRGVHWPSDVAASAVMGTACGMLAIYLDDVIARWRAKGPARQDDTDAALEQ